MPFGGVPPGIMPSGAVPFGAMPPGFISPDIDPVAAGGISAETGVPAVVGDVSVQPVKQTRQQRTAVAATRYHSVAFFDIAGYQVFQNVIYTLLFVRLM